ncbi:MAG TPA: TonB-dependent receptor [Steroidobacteraceae bacterium]|jgi:outer membrane receptor protein involved in Fe transport|nr:TonB-dependent receptor [Steroidobacteraceae bacterium]
MTARLAQLGTPVPSVRPLPAAAAFSRLGPRAATFNILAAAVAGILYCAGSAHAADEQTTPAASATSNSLEEVVVTASAQGVRKLDASYSIVSANLDEILSANPASAAELYKISPGIWPEASGGQTGVNIDVAGFPNGGGDSPYFTTMIQGSPLYGAPFLSFMDNSTLVRLDDTIERVEIVQGGTSAIFGPGQPGATANFILRTGSDKTEGSIGVTYGSEGEERVDAFLSGKMIDGWYGSLGGFYRVSDGIRNPQYPADIGGQLTATLKHDLDNGSLMFWYRALQDKNLWVADFPYIVVNGSPQPYPGFNQLNHTYNSLQLQNFLIPSPSGGFQNDNIGNGRGAEMNYFGSELHMSFGNGWSISNSFLFDGGNVNTSALVNNGNPQTLASFITSLGQCSGAGCTPQVPTALVPSIQASYANGGAVNPNQSVVTEQAWFVRKKITNVTDEFRVAFDFGNGNTLTGGTYVAHYTDNDSWSISSNVLMDNVPNASPIILQGTAGGNIYNVTSAQGIVNANGGYNILEQGQATNVAFYLSDSWKIDRWLFDADVRVEHIDMTQQTTNLSPVQLGTQFDLWDNAVSLPNGTYSFAGEINTMPTYSVGANYEFTDHMSAYVRANTGVTFDNFDAVRCNTTGPADAAVNRRCNSNPPLTTIRNYEVGFKVQNRYTYINADVYDKTFHGIPYTPTNIDDVPIGPLSTYGSKAIGVTLVGSVNPGADSSVEALQTFKITVNGNYEHAYYTDFNGCFIYTNIENQVICGTINGQPLARLPNFQVRVTPSDTQTMSWGTLTENVTYEHIGQHFQDNTGLNPLGSYYDLAAGIVATIGDNWVVRLVGSNLTNQLGLTEGNARFGGNAVQNSVGFGRSILGREESIQVKYKF